MEEMIRMMRNKIHIWFYYIYYKIAHEVKEGM